MRMLALAVLGTFLVSCGGGGGLSSGGSIPEAEACDQAATAFCTKVFACTSDPTVAAVAALYLMTEASCKTMVMQSCGSTGFQCAAGATYHGDQAQICKAQFSGQTCMAVSAAISAGITANSTAAAVASISAMIPACMMICTGGTDAGPG
jgi:hypothetical protein